ncbi:MAG: hypothetical protein Q8K20_17855 [Gemmobacter sp.]|nr:hypothetical protein [Gemmobacter sp.]
MLIDHPATLRANRTSLGVGWLTATTMALIVVTRALAVAVAPDVWLDEAMLMANLPLGSVAAAFQPLPLHAQAAPPGYLLVASAVSWVAGDEQALALRVLSVSGSLGASAFLMLTLLRLGAGHLAPVALALVFLSPFGVRYGIEIKQYSFELLATALLLYAAVRTWQQAGAGNLVLLGGAGVFAILSAFAAPLMIAGIAFALAACLFTGGAKARGNLAPLGVLSGLTVAAGIWHLTVTAAITAENFAFWADHYRTAYLVLPLPGQPEGIKLRGFLSIMLGMFDPSYRVSSGYFAARPIAVIGSLLLAAGLVTAVIRLPIIGWTCIAFLGGIAVLSLLQMYPIIYNRHFTFAQPVVGIVLAAGLASAVRGLSRILGAQDGGALRAGVAVLVVAGFGLVGARAAVMLAKTHLSGAVAVIAAETAGDDVLIHLLPSAAITMPFVAPTFKTQIAYKARPNVPAHATEAWLVETLLYDSDATRTEEVRDALADLGARFGPCTAIFRQGSDLDLGHTVAYRCAPAPR